MTSCLSERVHCTFFCPKFSATRLLYTICACFARSKKIYSFSCNHLDLSLFCLALTAQLVLNKSTCFTQKPKNVFFILNSNHHKQKHKTVAENFWHKSALSLWSLWILLIEYFVIFDHRLAEPVKLSSCSHALLHCPLSRRRPVVSLSSVWTNVCFLQSL